MKNLIGISGKKGSGKDTVGKIIDYLTWDNPQNIPYTEYCDLVAGIYDDRRFIGKYKIKKFAGKLKQMVALLIGCSVEDLEDEEFKNKPLGEEWNCFVPSPPRIGNYLYLTREEGKIHDVYPGLEERIMTPRLMLQLLGTEGMRDVLHPNVHVNALFADYKPKYFGGVDPAIVDSEVHIAKVFPNWIITDMRFPNELEAVKKRGGLTIRVERWVDAYANAHSSETALDNAEFDYTINNNGTIEQLIENVREILIKEGIINA